MSMFDKVIAAVTPPESDNDRAEARSKAQAAATPGDWLSLILDHHQQVESAFAAVASAGDAETRRGAQKRLGILLNGHSIAEEAVIYPALYEADEKGHANMAYAEQQAAKIQMAELEKLDPMSAEFHDKLEHIKGAVQHHVYEEEGTWFPELKDKASPRDQAVLAKRYREEFERYVGADADESFAPARTASATDTLGAPRTNRGSTHLDPRI
jgi:hemerythrin superfamily protein